MITLTLVAAVGVAGPATARATDVVVSPSPIVTLDEYHGTRAAGFAADGTAYVVSDNAIRTFSAAGVPSAAWALSVPTPRGAPLAAVTADGTVVIADASAGAVQVFGHYGEPAGSWTAPESAKPFFSLSPAPDGSLVISSLLGDHLSRYTITGQRLGSLPYPDGANAVVDPAGRAWTTAGQTVQRSSAGGRLLAAVGADCPIGGPAPPVCLTGVGNFNPQGHPLALASDGAGGIWVADNGLDRLSHLSASGAVILACEHLLPSGPVTSLAVLGDRMLLASEHAAFFARIVRGAASQRCARPRLTITRIRVRTTSRRTTVSFRLSVAAKVGARLDRPRVARCANLALTPLVAGVRDCYSLGGMRTRSFGRLSAGRHTIAVAHCRAKHCAGRRWWLGLGAITRAGERASTSARKAVLFTRR